MLKDIKKTAITAVKKSGKFLLKEYQNFNRASIKLKSHYEILTRNDLLSEEIIIKEINYNFPSHRVLSEEMGEAGHDSEYLWILDPIDGTTNFSIHNPLWSISIAVARNDEICLGVIYAPVLGELFIAEKDKGAELNGKLIAVSKTKQGKIINTFCHGREQKHIKKALAYYRKQKLKELDCRQLGSAAIELAYVACGRIESIMIPGANLWDVAAGVLLVREAGGQVTDFIGKQWNLDSVDMLASNGKIHKELLFVINSR